MSNRTLLSFNKSIQVHIFFGKLSALWHSIMLSYAPDLPDGENPTDNKA
jgi:hypothetical protein